MNATAIEWTTFSANPLKYKDKRTGRTVWACVKKSHGCAHCYAETIALRYQRGLPFTAENMKELTPYVDVNELKKIVTAKTVDGVEVSGKTCFIGDMTDIFGDWVPFELVDKIFAAMALRKDVMFQVLTKRPDRMAEYLDPNYMSNGGWCRKRVIEGTAGDLLGKGWGHVSGMEWPLPNVWLGTSIENQKAADERIPQLFKCPAAVRFLSCEPLLGPVRLPLNSVVVGHSSWKSDPNRPKVAEPLLHWVIVGGESGDKARPMHPDWVRDIRDDCEAAGVPLHFKQWGEWQPIRVDNDNVAINAGDKLQAIIHGTNRRIMKKIGKKLAGRELDGRVWDGIPLVVKESKNA